MSSDWQAQMHLFVGEGISEDVGIVVELGALGHREGNIVGVLWL